MLLLLSVVSTVAAGDWPRFRGPNGSGISPDEAAVPTEWSPTENLKWKTPLPGAGVSSPIVVGDRVFVTCYSGYGIDRRDPGEIENLKRHLVCVDRESGDVRWEKTIDAAQPEDPYSGAGVPSHGYASHTPISDGERVYVFFGKTGAVAFDLDGNQLWQQSVGTESDPRRWGSSSSPILYGNTLIVTASPESQAIVGLNVETGDEVWRQEASGLENIWGTPLLVNVDAKRTDLVLGVPNEIWGFNPENGKLRWYCEAMETDQFNSSVVTSNGVIYAIEGRGGGSIAVRAGGKGDVTQSAIVWSGQDSSRFGTPVVADNRLYYFSSDIANCINAGTGERIFRGRLKSAAAAIQDDGKEEDGDVANVESDNRGGGRGRRGGGGFGNQDYSSPVLADGKVYFVRGNGDTFVLAAGDEFKQLAVNRVTESSESFAATPAISDGQIFIRSSEHLYCIAAE